MPCLLMVYVFTQYISSNFFLPVLLLFIGETRGIPAQAGHPSDVLVAAARWSAHRRSGEYIHIYKHEYMYLIIYVWFVYLLFINMYFSFLFCLMYSSPPLAGARIVEAVNKNELVYACNCMCVSVCA